MSRPLFLNCAFPKTALVAAGLTVSCAFALDTPGKSFWTASGGISSLSFQEKEALQNEDTDFEKNAQSGSASILSLNLTRQIPFDSNQSVFIRGMTPAFTGESRLFLAGGGYSYFFGDTIISDTEITLGEGKITVQPGFRYYVGVQSDVGYLFYTSETARKTDLVFELGGHAGALYRWRDKMDIHAQVEFSQGIGSVANTTNLRYFLGLGFQLF